MIKQYWRELLIALLISVAIFQFQHPTTVETVKEVTNVLEIRQTVTKERVVYKNRDTIKETLTYGEHGNVKKKVVQQTISTETSKNVSKSDSYSRNEEKTSVTATKTHTNYNLGVSNTVTDLYGWVGVNVSVALRLGNTPFWLNMNATPFKNDYKIGVNYEF